MKKIIKLVVFLMCIFSLFGCFIKDKFILDGPGMVREFQWTSFTVSHSSSIANDNFAFSIYVKDDCAYVDGVCRDDEGNEYEIEEAIKLDHQTYITLRNMKLESLNDIKENKDSDLIILDDSKTSLSLTLDNNEKVNKQISFELAKEIYQLLFPYFSKI